MDTDPDNLNPDPTSAGDLAPNPDITPNTPSAEPDEDFSGSAIQDRLKDFLGGGSDSAAKEDAEKAAADKKAADDAAASKASEAAKKGTVTDPRKVGSDGQTKEERAANLALKQKWEAAEQTNRELQAKVKEGDATKAERDELKKRLADVEKERDTAKKEQADWLSKQDPIALEKVRMSEAYKANITIPTRRVEVALKDLCKGYDIEPSTILDAHYNPDRVARNKALSEAKAEMDDESKQELTGILGALQEIDRRESKIRQMPSQALADLQEAEKKKAQLQDETDQRAYGSARDAVWEHVIKKEFPEMAEEMTAEEIRRKADKVDWKNLSHDKKAYLANGAFIALKYRDANKQLQQKNAELTDALAKYTGTKSGPSGGDSPEKRRLQESTQTGNADEADDNMSMFDSITKWQQQNGMVGLSR